MLDYQKNLKQKHRDLKVKSPINPMKAIVFDVDDTLYDLSLPFKEAFAEVFPGEKIDLEGAFLASRRYSDSVYARSLSGEISMEEMYIYRFESAFRDYGMIIDAQGALEFQAVYEMKQQEIYMTEEMQQLLQKLKGKAKLGIITNGPAHQCTGCKRMDSSGTYLYIRRAGRGKAG